MTTALDGALKRALVVNGEPYTLTITPEGLSLVPKGRRNGYTLAWADLVSGEAALATALNASLHAGPLARRTGSTGASPGPPAATGKAAKKAPATAKRAPGVPRKRASGAA